MSGSAPRAAAGADDGAAAPLPPAASSRLKPPPSSTSLFDCLLALAYRGQSPGAFNNLGAAHLLYVDLHVSPGGGVSARQAVGGAALAASAGRPLSPVALEVREEREVLLRQRESG